MIGRIVQTASVLFALASLFVLAVAMQDGSSPFLATVTERDGDQTLHDSFAGEASNPRNTRSGTCDDDAAAFAACEAPVVPPLQPANRAFLQPPAMRPAAIFAEIPNAVDAGLASSRCLALIDACKTNNAENNVTPTVASCCGNVELPTPGVADAAPDASGCSCDPQECKCI